MKGYYECILKWRANEFKGTTITSISIYEDDKVPEESYIAISTKNS